MHHRVSALKAASWSNGQECSLWHRETDKLRLPESSASTLGVDYLGFIVCVATLQSSHCQSRQLQEGWEAVKRVFKWLMSSNIALVTSCLGELEETARAIRAHLPSLPLYHELWLSAGCGSRAFPAWHREAKQAATLRCDWVRGGATPQRHEPAVS